MQELRIYTVVLVITSVISLTYPLHSNEQKGVSKNVRSFTSVSEGGRKVKKNSEILDDGVISSKATSMVKLRDYTPAVSSAIKLRSLSNSDIDSNSSDAKKTKVYSESSGDENSAMRRYNSDTDQNYDNDESDDAKKSSDEEDDDLALLHCIAPMNDCSKPCVDKKNRPRITITSRPNCRATAHYIETTLTEKVNQYGDKFIIDYIPTNTQKNAHTEALVRCAMDNFRCVSVNRNKKVIEFLSCIYKQSKNNKKKMACVKKPLTKKRIIKCINGDLRDRLVKLQRPCLRKAKRTSNRYPIISYNCQPGKPVQWPSKPGVGGKPDISGNQNSSCSCCEFNINWNVEGCKK